MIKTGLVFVLVMALAIPSFARAALEDVASEAEVLVYQGQIATFADRLLSAGDRSKGAHLLQVGNMLYRLDLLTSIKLHEQALKLAPGDRSTLIELGYDYTAAERCRDAVTAWDELAAGGTPVDGVAAAIASYCHVVLGNFDSAVALWARGDYRSHHVGVEKAIHDVFGRPSPAMTHAEGFRTYSAEGWRGAGKWVRNAIFWRNDWWNQSSNSRALKGIRSVLESGKDVEALRELACVVAMEDLTPTKALEKAMSCGFLDGDQSTPRNSGVAYAVAVRIGNSQLATLEDQWGPELLRRAKADDVEALNLLAAIRASSNAGESLAEVDELGWKQYKLATFALSRLHGLGVGEPKPLPNSLRNKLAGATEAFPFDARLQMMSLVRLHSSGTAYRDAVARLIVAEFHSLSHSSVLSAQPNARGLDGFFDRLAAAQRALSEGKVPSVNKPSGE